MQTRLAVGMTALALAVTALVAVGGFLAAGWLGPSPEPRIETRVEQVGDSVALVRIERDVEGASASNDARRSTLVWVLAALGVAFVPAASLAWVVAGRLLRPVQRLTEVVDRVDGPGANERTGLARADELGALAAGLDGMFDRLEHQRREQERWLHEVVHELRTPLAIAGTNLELAGMELAGTAPAVEDGAARLAAARRAIERMSRTVDDLATNGRLTPGPADGALVDLAAEGRALVTEHLGPAELRGVHLLTEGPDELPVPADRAALRTATANLLSNALRVSPSGSTITVAWGRTGSWAWLAVRDEGPGVAESDHARVFERYWRGRYERDREDAETSAPRGLGLTIARQAVETQGGRLTVMSSPGEGATFLVWLPMSGDAEAAAVVAPDGVHPLADPLSAALPANAQPALTAPLTLHP
jgi:signal transduction histidine kinase